MDSLMNSELEYKINSKLTVLYANNVTNSE